MVGQTLGLQQIVIWEVGYILVISLGLTADVVSVDDGVDTVCCLVLVVANADVRQLTLIFS